MAHEDSFISDNIGTIAAIAATTYINHQIVSDVEKTRKADLAEKWRDQSKEFYALVEKRLNKLKTKSKTNIWFQSDDMFVNWQDYQFLQETYYRYYHKVDISMGVLQDSMTLGQKNQLELALKMLDDWEKIPANAKKIREYLNDRYNKNLIIKDKKMTSRYADAHAKDRDVYEGSGIDAIITGPYWLQTIFNAIFSFGLLISCGDLTALFHFSFIFYKKWLRVVRFKNWIRNSYSPVHHIFESVFPIRTESFEANFYQYKKVDSSDRKLKLYWGKKFIYQRWFISYYDSCFSRWWLRIIILIAFSGIHTNYIMNSIGYVIANANCSECNITFEEIESESNRIAIKHNILPDHTKNIINSLEAD